VLVVIVGALAIGAFIVLGVVAFVALGGILLVLAAVLGIRMWWLERKMPRQRKSTNSKPQPGSSNSAVIEGEYQDVTSDQDEHRSD